MIDFDRYFTFDGKVFLQNISYETFDKRPAPELKLNVKDTVLAQLTEKAVKVNFNRALTFQPEGLFSLSVTFGAWVVFRPETKDEIDWKSADIAGEIKKSNPKLLTLLMSQASLLVAEITSSAGQNPIITPSVPRLEQ